MAIRLFHISENRNIKIFVPRPSPSLFEGINGDVVFAISERLLHNYILPRDCPRVTFYSKQNTTQLDKERFLGKTNANYVIAVEEKWYSKIQQTILYCYEFPIDSFNLLDIGAEYYVSNKSVKPLTVWTINNILEELNKRNIELRVMKNLVYFSKEISQSTLQFSLIRMRNAITKKMKTQ